MVKENDKVDDIEIPDEENLEGLDETTDWKAKVSEIEKKHREAGIRNRERTKTLREKVAELEKKLKELPLPEKKEDKPDEKLLKKLNTALLRSYGYTDVDEIALVEKWQKDTGKDIEEMLTHPSLSKVIQAEIEEIRTTKANEAATKDIKGGGGTGGDKSKPEYWLDRNEMPPDIAANIKLNAEIIRQLAQRESGQGKKFYND